MIFLKFHIIAVLQMEGNNYLCTSVLNDGMRKLILCWQFVKNIFAGRFFKCIFQHKMNVEIFSTYFSAWA